MDSMNDLSPAVRRQVDISMLESRAILAPRMAFTGTLVAAGLCWSFWSGLPSRPLLAFGFAGIFCCYLVLYLAAVFWRRRVDDNRLLAAKILFSSLAALIGLFWAIVLITGLHDADLIQTSTLYALAIGLMSAPAFSGPALYALSLWTPIAIGSTLAILLDTATPPVPTLIGLFSYGFLTFSTILYVSRNTMEREFRRIEAERQSELINLLLRDFEEGASDFLWETDAHLTFIRPSVRLAEATLASPAHLASTSIIGFLIEHGRPDPHDPEADPVAGLIARIGRREPFNDVRVTLHFAGREHCWAIAGKPVFDRNHTFLGYRGVGSDVTAHRIAERRIAHIASHDSLTNLGNRMNFDTALRAACDAPAGDGTALVCLDLDHFKSVNDRFGHKAGDDLLRAVGGRLLGCVRTQDRCFRLGGDEFAILLPGIDTAGAEAITNRLVARLAEPFRLDDVTVTVGTCAGIAMIREPGVTPEHIHHAADLALYRAKASGRGSAHLFDPEYDRRTNRMRDINTALLNAFDAQIFFLEYQPIVRLETGEVTAVEALIRWDHPEYGVLSPDEFIRAAEQNGAIVRLGAFVIEAACAFAATLPGSIAVAINLSPVQLHDTSLVDRITDAMARHGLGPGRIAFELTETAILDPTPETFAILHRIRNLGCRLSLDDFGSGYSSIATLYYCRFDRLKIDRTLIHDAMGDTRRRTILRNMTRLAREIGLTVTAEGVETSAHRATIAELGFDEGQGNLFALALPDAGLRGWLGLRTDRVRAAGAPVRGPDPLVSPDPRSM